MATPTSGAAGSPSRPPNDPGLVRLIAEALASVDSFAVDAGGLLYIYRDGVYIPEAEQHIKQAIKQLLIAWDQSKRWSKHLVDEVIAYLAADAPLLWERPPLDVLNVVNGLLDVKSHMLQPHTPAYLSTVQLPVQFNPTAACPVWERFLAAVLPRDVIEAGTIWSIIAYLMLPITDAHQAFLVSGPGGNGKSTFLFGLRSLLGASTVASQNLDAISGDRFAAAHLYGKLANICDDLSSRHLADTSTFKRIVGGDSITADRKYRDPLVFRPFARLVFSANEFPQCADASSGFYDRWVVVPFNANFRGQQSEIPRNILDAQLAAPQELSGVLNRALAALPSILGRRLPIPPSMKAAHDEFRNSTDWVLIWLERMLIEQPTGVVEKKAIHQALIQEAQRQRRAVISPTALYRQVRKKFPNIIETQRRLDPIRDGVPCFVGLSWRQGVPPV